MPEHTDESAYLAEAQTRALADDLCVAGHDLDPNQSSACQECYDLACAVMDTPWLARLAEAQAEAERQRAVWFSENSAAQAALGRVRELADLYDEAGRTRTVKPPWAHIATEVRNAARGSHTARTERG